MASTSGCSSTLASAGAPSCACPPASKPSVDAGVGGFEAPAPQFALLDMFFPGFSVFSSAVERYFKVDLNLYIPLALFLGAVTFAWQYFSEYFWEKLEAHFMSTVDIRTDDEIYNMLMAWVAQQKFAKGARRFVVNTNLNSRSWYLWRWDEDEEEGPEEGDDNSAQHRKKRKALAYTPTFGSHFFWYKGRICIFRRDKGRDQQAGYMLVSEREEISISCFGRNPWLLKELLLEARTQFTQRDEHKTLIYRGTIPAGTTTPTWQRCLARASRPFSTVILNDQVKQDLIDDVEDYLNPATRRWYSNRGIPYRRGYLLYGPPGTGKSSLSLALAGFFKMRIYIVSLSSVTSNEENLSTLFAELPGRCVVLLEDIDTAGLTHTREDKPRDESGDGQNDSMVPGQLTKGTGPNGINNNSGRLSLSGLLNILDGVASQEGRVLIMTTNHVDKLDKALIRPGRVDMIVKFDLADTGMISAIFRAIFAPLEGDNKPAGTGAEAARDPEEVKQRVAADKARRDDITAEIEKLAEEFAARIPAHEFSPAELQGYLMKNKRDPEGAVGGAEAWVVEARKEKAAKQLKEAEDKRKQEEEDKKKAKAEADKKKEDEEREEKKKKKSGKSKKKDRKAKKESSRDSESGSSSDSSSEPEPEEPEVKNEAKREKRSKSKGSVDAKVKTGDAKDEQEPKAPVSAATDKSDRFVDVERESVDDCRPRTRGTDSGYGTP